MGIFSKSSNEDKLEILRQRMVFEQIEKRGVTDPNVLDAMNKVPRHLFVPEKLMEQAYLDGPLSIGEGQTISQPYVVGSMTAHLGLTSKSNVLEIGTGSGYQTAVLAEIAEQVFTIERIENLLDNAKRVFDKLGYRNINTKLGDGSRGWTENAPFDAIIVTAAAQDLPQQLIQQLKVGGVLVIPLERGAPNYQELVKIIRTENGIQSQVLYPVRFVPLLSDSIN